MIGEIRVENISVEKPVADVRPVRIQIRIPRPNLLIRPRVLKSDNVLFGLFKKERIRNRIVASLRRPGVRVQANGIAKVFPGFQH